MASLGASCHKALIPGGVGAVILRRQTRVGAEASHLLRTVGPHAPVVGHYPVRNLPNTVRNGSGRSVSMARTEGRRDRSRDPAILNAALSVLTEHGYYATNMNYIAARAGVGKAAIYRRWASKAALITDALVYWRPDLLSNPLQHRRLARRRRFPCPTSQTQRRAGTVSCRRTWLFERRLARANRCCAAANRSTAARPQRGLSTRSRR
jgi:hypothetical protein